MEEEGALPPGRVASDVQRLIAQRRQLVKSWLEANAEGERAPTQVADVVPGRLEQLLTVSQDSDATTEILAPPGAEHSNGALEMSEPVIGRPSPELAPCSLADPPDSAPRAPPAAVSPPLSTSVLSSTQLRSNSAFITSLPLPWEMNAAAPAPAPPPPPPLAAKDAPPAKPVVCAQDAAQAVVYAADTQQLYESYMHTEAEAGKEAVPLPPVPDSLTAAPAPRRSTASLILDDEAAPPVSDSFAADPAARRSTASLILDDEAAPPVPDSFAADPAARRSTASLILEEDDVASSPEEAEAPCPAAADAGAAAPSLSLPLPDEGDPDEEEEEEEGEGKDASPGGARGGRGSRSLLHPLGSTLSDGGATVVQAAAAVRAMDPEPPVLAADTLAPADEPPPVPETVLPLVEATLDASVGIGDTQLVVDTVPPLAPATLEDGAMLVADTQVAGAGEGVKRGRDGDGLGLATPVKRQKGSPGGAPAGGFLYGTPGRPLRAGEPRPDAFSTPGGASARDSPHAEAEAVAHARETLAALAAPQGGAGGGDAVAALLSGLPCDAPAEPHRWVINADHVLCQVGRIAPPAPPLSLHDPPPPPPPAAAAGPPDATHVVVGGAPCLVLVWRAGDAAAYRFAEAPPPEPPAAPLRPLNVNEVGGGAPRKASIRQPLGAAALAGGRWGQDGDAADTPQSAKSGGEPGERVSMERCLNVLPDDGAAFTCAAVPGEARLVLLGMSNGVLLGCAGDDPAAMTEAFRVALHAPPSPLQQCLYLDWGWDEAFVFTAGAGCMRTSLAVAGGEGGRRYAVVEGSTVPLAAAFGGCEGGYTVHHLAVMEQKRPLLAATASTPSGATHFLLWDFQQLTLLRSLPLPGHVRAFTTRHGAAGVSVLCDGADGKSVALMSWLGAEWAGRTVGAAPHDLRAWAATPNTAYVLLCTAREVTVHSLAAGRVTAEISLVDPRGSVQSQETTASHAGYAVTSLGFHPRLPVVCFADSEGVVWLYVAQ